MMKRFLVVTVVSTTLCSLLSALPTSVVLGQQTQPTHRYLVRAVLTTEGLKSLQKQSPTALKAAVAKFDESVGGKLEFWYFDYGESTAYSIVDFPDEIAAATAQAAANAGGFARVTFRPVLSAEELDKAVAKLGTMRVPQQQ
jgi:uncharacterized protein with GYD domain